MRTYLVLFGLAFAGTILMTPLIIRFCRRFRWLDRPDGQRKLHRQPIPRLGGIGIILAFLASMGAMFLYDNAITRQFMELAPRLGWVLLMSLVVSSIGLVDDVRGGIGPWFKFLVQIGAAAALWSLGFRVSQLTVPLAGTLDLGLTGGLFFTVAWLVSVTNAFNFIDGMDGLAAGIALVVAVSILGMALVTGKPEVPMLAAPLAGALAGFLPYNWNPARIFMGDAGSYFLGFMLGAMSIISTTKSSTLLALSVPVAMLGIPLLDTLLAVMRRFLTGQPLFGADGDHIHHRLLKSGMKQHMVVLLLYGITVLMAALATISLLAGPNRWAVLIPMAMGALTIWLVWRLGYDEFREFIDMMQKAFRFQRLVIANQVRLRRFQHDIQQAADAAELFTRIETLLEGMGFEHMSLTLALESPGKPPDAFAWGWYNGSSLFSRNDPDTAADDRFWQITIPLQSPAGWKGCVTLSRSMEREKVMFQMASLLHTFSTVLAECLEKIGPASIRTYLEKNREIPGV